MEPFKIIKIKNEKYEFMILSISYINPFDELEKIEKKLKKKNYKGYVIFDLYLSHANNDYRFAEGYFNGEHFVKSEFKWLSKANENIKKISNKFFYTHPEYIDNSLLSSVDKLYLKEKMFI
ncbi:type II toxin-antitoxin system RnlB family antitoxin [Marinitoga aeolica]|uniref:Type II toxin-antitoxin system RnlB family antitoxin n=1 Tax=Marinitoga aeolica TaxID=2809031 RepID=A0ABY8PPU1_9BACT|nr:type II toxin-antitoxin system RnlB family antitoxin [Marinitoga aeolica]WGS64657.1 type II toxin-antitoxin system RnlB family antitoxin [Marinitoga aeolica]